MITRIKPITNAIIPASIESWPRSGQTVISSIILVVTLTPLPTFHWWFAEAPIFGKKFPIASDLFISALYEMEGDLIAEITTVILEVSADQLLAYDGRENLSLAIQKHLNEYLVGKDYFPGITEVFITNFNVV